MKKLQLLMEISKANNLQYFGKALLVNGYCLFFIDGNTLYINTRAFNFSKYIKNNVINCLEFNGYSNTEIEAIKTKCISNLKEDYIYY